ncbi:MAG: transglycosylase SLT domain-containing protein [Candidatus Eremiobacteraeota bacterium]|nr:transglycosylase SLT domain-containing protein [Candidatus Eremiobacteraeota bacterium]
MSDSLQARGPFDREPALQAARIDLTEERVESWRLPLPAAELRGLRLLYDTPIPSTASLAVVRSVVRANHRLDPFDALVLATRAVEIAREHSLAYGFFCGTLLQESAFAPDALSAAGAVGIGQFTLDTAQAWGIDPFDWRDAMRGSAALLGSYVHRYDGVYADPYAAALAAYNAGPGTVAYYRGVPPYPETREYIGDIYDRWSRIARDAGGWAAAAGRAGLGIHSRRARTRGTKGA